MRVSYEWLKELVDVTMSAEEAADALTGIGLEVEGIEKADRDYVLEVNVTPNRSDCLSHLGIARELSAIAGKPLKFPHHDVKEDTASDFRLEILDEALCRRYAGRIIRGVKLGESPDWMQEKLEACGVRAINNIVDITNYVLLELGHPLHAFDLATLEGQTIRVGVAGKGNSITTLDGAKRSLPEKALLIWDAKRPVAVAGVMGGADTEVTAGTVDIFLESAWFKPESVRRTSKALGLSTEASYRFERGTDILNLEGALDRAVHLILEVAGGKASGLIDAFPGKFNPVEIPVNLARINRWLGTELSVKKAISLLEKLGLEIRSITENAFTVVQPSYRPDLMKEVDIIEEVARLYGYGNIPTVLPRTELAAGENTRRTLIKTIKETLKKEGFHDAINFSFMNTTYLDILKLEAEDRRRRCVEIKNPLRPEDSHLRTMLVPSLIENFIYNFSRGMRDVRLFELSRVFEEIGKPLPKETLHLGGIFSRDRAPSLYPEAAEDFYLLKGSVESLLDRLKIAGYSFAPSDEPFLHKGKAANLLIGDDRIGYIGVLSPAIFENLDIKSAQDVLVFELDVEKLLAHLPKHLVYTHLPKYPAIERDIAIVLDEGMNAAQIIGKLKSFPSEYIEEVGVFDSFKGKNIPEGKKSLAFSIRYRSKERTLTDAEVEEVHAGLVKHLLKETGGEVRGG